jgi:hypothetical protein
MQQERALPQAIDALYSTFAGNGVQLRLHSMGPRAYDARRIASQPLRSLPAEAIADFVFELGLSVGDAGDIRWLAPRLLHLAALGTLPVVADAPVAFVLRKLARAGWLEWPAAEREALRQFFHALLDERLREGGAHALLLGLAFADDDLAPYLARVRASPSEAAAQAIGCLAQQEASALLSGRSSPASAELPPERREQLLAWLRADETLEQLTPPQGERSADPGADWRDEAQYALHVLRGDADATGAS